MSSAAAADPIRSPRMTQLTGCARSSGNPVRSAPAHLAFRKMKISRERGEFWHTNRSRATASSATCGPRP